MNSGEKNKDTKSKEKMDETKYTYKEIKEEEYRKHREMLLRISKPSVIDRFFVPIALIGMIFTITNIFTANQSYVDQEKIKSHINTLIDNNAGLNTIKHVFNNKEVLKKYTLVSMLGKKEDTYPDNISLSIVLSDIKADLFLAGKPDADKLERIDYIIKSNNEQNPFDGLPENQRDIFNNIVLKSNSNYSNIQSDVNKLANEIRTKNIQIENNDVKVEVSYYITIISFITAIAIAAFQLFQSRPKKTKEIVVAALNEIEAKSNEMPNK